jgi:hypothetical protein
VSQVDLKKNLTAMVVLFRFLFYDTKPMVVHFAEKGFGNRESRLRADHRIDMAFGAKRCAITFLEPLFNRRRRINVETIEATAFFACHDFLSMLFAMLMSTNVSRLVFNFEFH